jgi:hypothetical protein
MESGSIRKPALDSIDTEYRFGRPIVYLAPHELARLMILRSRLGDTQTDRVARAAGTAATHYRTRRTRTH